ncbi:lipopolysaccharide biosynthesis protein [Staphylococcus simulans]|uniref:lipopolysaccharide biosynthesis protein n=1 Tax=Staphylococcus simulans TaxID=1286 RepID=UPI001A8D155B|nr:hypothetical protein [Staphylococcus simulans]
MIYLLGNVVFGFSQWIAILLFIKFGTGQELGAYTYSIALIAPLILLFSFGYNTMIVTIDDLNKNVYFFSRCLFSMILFFVYLVIIFVNFGFSNQFLGMVIVVAIAKILENVLDIDFAYLIKAKQQYKVGIYKLWMSVLQISLLLVFMYLFREPFLPFLFYSLVLVGVIIFKNKDKFRKWKNVSFESVKVSTVIGFPISITLFLSSLNTNIPKYILEYTSNLVYVGIFSSLLIIYSAGNTFFFSVYNFMLPKMVEKKNDSKYLKKILRLILLSGLAMFLLVILITPFVIDPVMELLYNEKFMSFKTEFVIVILASILVYLSILFDLYINSHKKYKFNTKIQIISVIVVVITGLMLIPNFKILGAVISFLVFAITVFVLKLIYSTLIIRRVKYE